MRAVWLIVALTACNSVDPRLVVEIEPANPGTLDDLVANAQDLEGNPASEVRFQWEREGQTTGESGHTVTNDLTTKGELWTATAVDEDGIEAGQASVRVVNSTPVVETASFEFSPGSHVEVIADITDDDDDPTGLLVEWTVNGEVLPDTDAQLSWLGLTKGDAIAAVVWPHDDEDSGAAYDIDSAAVPNQPPTVDVLVSPEAAISGTELTCTFVAHDGDGDSLSSTIEWFVDGSPISNVGTTFDTASRGQAIHCEVTTSDATAQTTGVANTVIVENAPPTLTHAEITPSPAVAGEDLTCNGVGYHDHEGDPDQSEYQWWVDGILIETTAVLLGGANVGQLVECDVTASDGTASGATSTASVAIEPARRGGNVLVVIADDLGTDGIAAYGHGIEPPNTPNLDALIASGVRFNHFWSMPVCSPTRAAILTGRTPQQTGIGRGVQLDVANSSLSLSEITLPSALTYGSPFPYAHAAIGKWHLSTNDELYTTHPLAAGFSYHAGSMRNLAEDVEPGVDGTYDDWLKSVMGATHVETTYATTDTTDDAIEWIASTDEPWFMWLAYNAPHYPLHEPPAHLHTRTLGEEPESRDLYDAMVEALDTEFGRLVDQLPPDTTVIFLGDNGAPSDTAREPYQEGRIKHTLYEGGIKVPLIVSGPWAHQPGVSNALVQATDLFATVIDLTGTELSASHLATLDSVSFLPQVVDPDLPTTRPYVTSQYYDPNNGSGPLTNAHEAVRNERYKYMQWIDGEEALYDMQGQVAEQDNLLDGVLSTAEEAAYLQLKALAESARPLNP